MSAERHLYELLARRRRLRRRGGVALLVALPLTALVWAVLPTVPGLWPWGGGPGPGPEGAASALAEVWAAGEPWRGPTLQPSAEIREAYQATVEGMDPAVLSVELVEVEDGSAANTSTTATFAVTWTMPGQQGPWEYTTSAELLEGEEDGWRVLFDPAVVHPELEDGDRLVLRSSRARRGDILGGDGTPIVTDRPVVNVGVQPSRVEDLDALATRLEDLLDIDAAALGARVEAAADDAFVEVITLREEDYDALSEELQPLPGTVFSRGSLALAPSRGFARELLGAAGPVTAELLEEHPDRYRPGDVVGLSGLQRQFDEHLLGSDGLEIVAVAASEPGSETSLHQVDPVAGASVALTLDERIQTAAEAALADLEHPSALVALRVSDGHVLAAANGPAAGGLDLALRGQFPPGSTFKVVTTSALLSGGLSPSDQVDCVAQASAGGRSFRNAEAGALGAVPFAEAFAHSCNTTFVTLADRLDEEALHDTASMFGLGAADDLGIGAYRGSIPVNDADVDQAAAMIGQGRNLASPLALADVAATVARGHHLPLTLIVDPSQEATARSSEPLDPAVVDQLRSLMRRVVTDGSGGALADVPGAPVHGKTGTAEYGEESPPRTHAWFIGYQDDLAVAVLVAETENSFGGRVAAPVAADFLRQVQR